MFPIVRPPAVTVVLGLAVILSSSVPPAAAQLAGRAAEEWIKTLDSPARVERLRIPEMVAALKITPGQTIADIGAGSGVVSGPLALATGPTGTMYATDIDKALLAHIDQRAKQLRIANLKTVLSTPDDAKLPAQVDLAFMHDVLHHVSDRAGLLENLATYVKPGGRIAIVDYRPENSPHRGQPELVITEEHTDSWVKAAGLKKSESVGLFDDRFYVIYIKP